MITLRILIFQLIISCKFIKSEFNVKNLNIGAIFTSNNREQELAFKKGIEEANKILTEEWEMKKDLPRFHFKYIIMNIKKHDSFEASEKACELLKKKVIAIIGPTDSVAADEIESIYAQFGIPFLDMSPASLQPIQRKLSINLYPHYSSITTCITDFFKNINRVDGTIVIIYLKSEDLIKFTDLINKFEQQVVLKKIQFDVNDKYLMKYLKSKKYLHFIVDIPYWNFAQFMKTADNYNMTNQFYAYLFTDWDTQLLNLKNLTFNTAANITTLALVPIEDQNSKDKSIIRFQKEISEIEKSKHNTEIFTLLTTETAIIYDSLRLLAKGLVSLAKLSEINLSSTLSCSSKANWAPGISFLNAIKSIPIKSLTGNSAPITVDENGWRDNFQISIRQLYNRSHFESFNTWNKTHRMGTAKPTRDFTDVNVEISKQTLRVTTVVGAPFVISKRKDANGVYPKDPDAWEGFCVEIMKEIAFDLGFNFTIEEVEDKKYGELVIEDGEGRWNGLVGALVYHKADLAVSSLTITYDREKVIDFTTPFMNLGISIIYKKPPPKPVELFSFLSPLSVPVWGYVVASYISVSFVLFVVGRFTPYEWYNSSPCQKNPEFSSNRFNILNSLWFTIGTFMQQGIDIMPKASSTRIIAGIWWFFTLIIISSYTANLAAFLTVARMNIPIENAKDLSKQVKIPYGTVAGGTTFMFFQKSKLETYMEMFDYMKRNKQHMVASNEDGIERVKTKDYVFILESTTNEYYIQRDCSLMKIGGLLDSKGYGIGLPAGSRYRDAISESILKLQKSQKIEALRRKYWRDYNITTPCTPQEKTASTSSLGITEVGGVFVMLFVGIGIGLFIAVFELFYKANKKSHVNKTGICAEIKEILKLNISCYSGRNKSQVNDTSNDSSPITYPVTSIDHNRHLTTDPDDGRNSHCEPINKAFNNLPYDYAIRPSSPIYHLPPATNVQPPIINPIQQNNYKMIFQDSHITSNPLSSVDTSSNCQVRMKKLAC